MKWLLIGHRGVGKTHLMERLKSYFKNSEMNAISYFDLDQEIEKEKNRAIIDLWPEVGEQGFRAIEHSVFKKIHSENENYIVSLGAGFSLDFLKSELYSDCRIIWIRRKTDDFGRIFFNRPRLNTNISPLAEFKERQSTRQINYQKAAHEVYLMPEGIEASHEIEKQIFTNTRLSAGGILTLLPWHFNSPTVPSLRYECDYYEIRDDLLDVPSQCWLPIERSRRLLSFRNKNNFESSFKYLSEMAESDWALELGPCPQAQISIISSHDYLPNENLTAFLKRLEESALESQHLKAAPIIKSYQEWDQLLRWQKKAPDRRSILPRSEPQLVGRWVWARLLMKGCQKINFLRDSDGSAADQPTLFEWLGTPNKPTEFAALLGNPVIHSRTMVEQSSFFAERKWPVWPILLTEEEFSESLPMLSGYGLRAAAVTSPLKKVANELAKNKTSEALALQSVNTLVFTNDQVSGHNTDLTGFQKLIESASKQLDIPISNLSSVIWGGGGTLPTILEILPSSIALSVRSSQTRNPDEKIPSRANLLIWAAGPEDAFPPQIKIDMIVDLNYREDSRARELALNEKVKYISGETMFKAQAEGQRQFWKKSFSN